MEGTLSNYLKGEFYIRDWSSLYPFLVGDDYGELVSRLLFVASGTEDLPQILLKTIDTLSSDLNCRDLKFLSYLFGAFNQISELRNVNIQPRNSSDIQE